MQVPIGYAFIASQLFGLVAMVFIWLGGATTYNYLTKAEELLGFEMSSTVKLFQFHPPLMLTAMYYVGIGIVIYRVMYSYKKSTAKLVHIAVHTLGFASALAGFAFAIMMIEYMNGTHFFTIHSIVGLLTLVLFTFQWLVAIPIFLLPNTSTKVKNNMKKIHVCIGIGLFICGTLAALTGLSKSEVLPQLWNSPSKSSSTAIYYMVAALLFLVYALIVLFIVINNDYHHTKLGDLKSFFHL